MKNLVIDISDFPDNRFLSLRAFLVVSAFGILIGSQGHNFVSEAMVSWLEVSWFSARLNNYAQLGCMSASKYAAVLLAFAATSLVFFI